MRILRATDYRRMPWKNGKGETVEIAVFPPGASVGDFDWRISMATVVEDGPFSIFDGVDRTLSILSGEGIELFVAGEEPATLCRETAPHAFPADAATSARLLKDAVTDLNVMTRRGRFTHRVERVELPCNMEPSDTTTLLFAVDGLSAALPEITAVLSGSESIYLPNGHRDWLVLSGIGACIVVKIHPSGETIL